MFSLSELLRFTLGKLLRFGLAQMTGLFSLLGSVLSSQALSLISLSTVRTVKTFPVIFDSMLDG